MLYIVDEASMLSSSQGHELIKHIERVGARLVLVGDRAQLPSISCGRIFGLTQDYDLKTSVMDEIVRQKNKDLLKAVVHATKGEAREALDNIEVKELSSHEKRVDWIANHWLSLSEEVRDQTLLFAPTHANREAITQRIREGLIKEGVLKNAPITQNKLQSKQLEAIQLRFTANYQKDDVLRFNQDFRQHRVKQGEYYRIDGITKIHRRDNVLPLMDKDGNTLLFPLKSLPQYKTHTSAFERIIEVYKESPIELRVGDKIQWTRNFKSENVRNGDCAILDEIREKDLVFKDKNGLETILSKDSSTLKHIDYGFVLTNYKVQGKDAPYGIGLMESYRRFSVTMENFYVQISRAVHGMILVTDNKEELIHALESRNHEKLASLDVLSSENIKTHQEIYKKYTSISIQPVIEKQRQRENINNDLAIEVSKNIYPNKTKELER
jgi:ATP-dependent exoDNAse (exonuclease V) alpha subunit